MTTIKINTGRVSAFAGDVRTYRQRVEAAARNIDAALRPARRGDVPELGAIDGTYGPLRHRLSMIGYSLRDRATDLQRYVNRAAEVEGLLQLAGFRLQLSDGQLAFGSPTGSLPPGMTPEEAAGLGIYVWDVANHGQPGLYDFITSSQQIDQLTFLGSQRLAVGMAVTPLSLILDGKTVLDPNAVVTDRAYSAVSFTVTATGMTGTAFTMLGATETGAVLVGASTAAGPVVIAIGGGLMYGNHLRGGYERDEAMGVNTLDRIGQDFLARPTAGHAVTSAVDVAGYGVYSAAEWGGARFYGVQEYVPDDLVGNDAAKVILATIRTEHPNATLAQLDGRFVINIPNDDTGQATKYVIDNDTWRNQ